MPVPTLCVNFYGGPSVGKSTMCAHVFAELKWRGINCEMSREYAKDVVWEGSLDILDDQLHVFGEQYHRLHRLVGKVDIILTDSPLLLSLIYGKKLPQEFRDLVLHQFNSFNNFNIVLTRQKRFNPAGRVHNEEQSHRLDDEICNLLKDLNVAYICLPGERDAVNDALSFINMAYYTMRKRTGREFFMPEEDQ